MTSSDRSVPASSALKTGAKPPVVVVGGGFAGLSAAALLAEHGERVVVLEARPRLGGRATAFPDRHSGEPVDNGQHVMFGCYRETMAFLRRVGGNDNVRVQQALEIPFIDTDQRRTVLKCPPLPAPLHLLAGVFLWDALSWRDRVSALRVAPALVMRSSAAPKGTVTEWLRRHGQTARLIERLWEPLAVAALNQPIDQAAAAPFLRVLHEMFGPDRTASALVLPTTPLDEMYATPARTFIEDHGGLVRTDSLARVIVENGRISGVDVRGERLLTDTVISSVPWHQLRTLFPVVPQPLADVVEHASAMDSMPIVTVNLWYDRVVMDDAFVGLAGRSMQWIFDKRRVFGEQWSHLSLVSSAALALTPLAREELIALAAREVAESLPAARGAILLRGTLVREKHATFSLSAGQPPRPAARTPLPGFFLAGDWTDTALPGTIESAVVSGHAAAHAILNL
ncbi:MAG: hydroxysqualene dehydroxylase HpnE [Vicinamibacterales bacterium]